MLRFLRKSPGFAASAVATLALGIGLATAVFTVANALLLRRLPLVEQERLVRLTGRTKDGRMDRYPLGVEQGRDFARRTRATERIAFAGYEGAAPQAIRDGDALTRIKRSLVSGDFFTVLGATPVLGRTLRPEDDVFGADPVMVLSHRAWQERYGGSPDVIGRRIVLHADGTAYTVVGVMPRGLDFPRGTDAWAPIFQAVPERNLQYVALDLIARLAHGATPEMAQDELTTYLQRPEAPEFQRAMTGAVRSLPDLIVGDTRQAVFAFSAAAALLLLITCIDVANLLLVRELARAREVAVRSALGAGRWRIVRERLAEHATIAAAGGAMGLVVAWGALRLFLAAAPEGLPRLDEVRLDAVALIGALSLTTLATLAFGVGPAFAAARSDAGTLLRGGVRVGTSARARRVTEWLVVGQIALAVVILSAAGILTRSLVRLQRAELAFDPSRLVVGELALRSDVYDTPDKQRAMLDRVIPQLKEVAGVRAVSPVVAVPFSGTHGWDGSPSAEGQTTEQAQGNPMLNMEVVVPGYFQTFAMQALRGRVLEDGDRAGAPAVVVLSQSAADAYWPNESPIGKRLFMGPPGQGPSMTVVGVVPDTRYRDLREKRPSIYFPLAQSFFPFVPTSLVIRADAPARDVVAALRRILAENAPGVEVASAAPLDDFMATPLAQPRFNALLLAIFAGAAAALAAIGLFGVMATMVRQRRREFGVRLAVGATSGAVAGLVMRRGVRLALIGASLGLVGAIWTNRLLSSLLFEVSPTDPLTLGAIVALLVVVAAIATALPARAGAKMDPVQALRVE